MSRMKSVVRSAFDPAEFVHRFVDLLQTFQSEDDLKNLGEKLRQISDLQWRLEIIDQLNPSCRGTTLLNFIALPIILCDRPKEMKLSLLVELIEISPVDLWEIEPPLFQSSEDEEKILKRTPRGALLELCKEQDGKVYLCALSNLLVRMPFEMWAKDVVEYLKFAKKLFLSAGKNIPVELSSFVDVLSTNILVDLRVWFEPTIQECGSEMAGKVSLLSLVMNRLGRSIQILDKHIQEMHAAGELQNSINSPACIVQRRNTTHLIRVMYEIAKRSSADHWDPISASSAPLNELLDLMLIGFRHELMMKITQHVLSKASHRAIEFISPEQKEKIAQDKDFSVIISILEGHETPVVDLMDTLFLMISSEEYVSRLMQLTDAQIMRTQVEIFSNITNDRWVHELTHRNCPPEFVGLTLLHAIILVLIKKLSDPVLMEQALMKLVECVPAGAWDQSASGKKVSVDAKSSAAIAHSPRHLIWNLCRLENGSLFLSVLYQILYCLPSERWQAEIPEYLKLVLKLVLKQDAGLELAVAKFFSLLVSRSPAEENNWFRQFNFDEKQKRKGSAPVVVTAPICILIDTLSAILKKMPFNPQICSVLTTSLTIIVERSAADDWEPGITINGVIDLNGPLNHLVKLMLDDPQNPYFCKIVETVLKKATQESVNYISRENREKILVMPQFAKNKKLLDASYEKKLAAEKAAAEKAKAEKIAAEKKAAAEKAKVEKIAAEKKAAAEKAEKAKVEKIAAEKKAAMEAHLSAHQQSVSENSSDNTDKGDDDDLFIEVPPELRRPVVHGSWADDVELKKYQHNPYSFAFNRKVIIKSGDSVTVSDAVYCTRNDNRVN